MNTLANKYREILFATSAFLIFFLYFITQEKFLKIGLILGVSVTLCTLYFMMRGKTFTFSLYRWMYIGITYIINVIMVSCIYLLFTQNYSTLQHIDGIYHIALTIFTVYAVYSAITIVAYELGRPLTRLFKISNDLPKSSTRLVTLGLGFSSSILWFYFFSSIRSLRTGIIFGFIVSVLILLRSFPKIYRYVTERVQTTLQFPITTDVVARSWLIVILMAIGSTFLILHFSSIIHNGDDWRTYLNLPLTFLAHNGVVTFPYDPLNQAPFIGTYFLIPLISIQTGIASLQNVYFYLLTLTTTYILARRIIGDRGAFFATTITALISLQLFYLASVRPDGLMIFLFMVTMLIFSHAPLLPLRWYMVIGVFTGIMIGIKYNALFAVIINMLILANLTLPWKKYLHAGSLIMIGIILTCAPWGIYNSLRYGNPLHPFLSSNHYQYFSKETGTRENLKKFSREDELRSFYYNSDSTLLEKILTTSFVKGVWPINNLGPLLILAIASSIIFFQRNKPPYFIYIIPCTAAILLWHASDINQIHYLSFLFPLLAIILGHHLAHLKFRLIGIGIIALLALTFAQDAGLLKKSGRIYLDSFYLARDKKFIHYVLTTSRYFARSKLIAQLESIKSDYLILPFSDVNLTNIPDNYRHVYNNYAQSAWANIVFSSKNDVDIIKNLQSKNITHIFVPRNEPYDDRNPLSEKYPLSLHLHNQKENLLKLLPIEIQNEYGIIYRIPQEIQKPLN